MNVLWFAIDICAAVAFRERVLLYFSMPSSSSSSVHIYEDDQTSTLCFFSLSLASYWSCWNIRLNPHFSWVWKFFLRALVFFIYRQTVIKLFFLPQWCKLIHCHVYKRQKNFAYDNFKLPLYIRSFFSFVRIQAFDQSEFSSVKHAFIISFFFFVLASRGFRKRWIFEIRMSEGYIRDIVSQIKAFHKTFACYIYISTWWRGYI